MKCGQGLRSFLEQSAVASNIVTIVVEQGANPKHEQGQKGENNKKLTDAHSTVGHRLARLDNKGDITREKAHQSQCGHHACGVAVSTRATQAQRDGNNEHRDADSEEDPAKESDAGAAAVFADAGHDCLERDGGGHDHNRNTRDDAGEWVVQ
jgi:hypothetical protein